MNDPREPESPGNWRSQPWALGSLGVALMVAGWLLMSYVPTHASGGLLDDLREWAAEQSKEEGAAGLSQRLPGREAPYRLPGRLVLVAGVVLFLAAGVRMWERSPEKDRAESGVEEPAEREG